MPKINFKDYSDNYREIKIEDAKRARELKKQKKKEDKNHRYKLNEDTMQQCLELKKYLEVLKSSANSNSMNKEEIKKFIFDKLKNIHNLKKELISKNDNIHIFFNTTDNVKNIIIEFIIATITVVLLPFFGALVVLNSFPMSLFCALVFYVVFDEILGYFALDASFARPRIRRGLKALIGMLPFNNRYSFVKTFRKLEKLENEYNKFSSQYENYLNYLENPEKSEVAENIIKGKEVKDVYLLEITKLVDKVKELPLGEDRDKYLEVLEKLTELYKREKERIILKNGYVHSEEERELGISVIKQLAYIEMQINSSIYKNKNVNLLSEDYLTTLGKLDNAKGKKLKRTLGLGK